MNEEPKLIRDWSELKDCKSDTHYLKIDLYYCSGWIRPKDKKNESGFYLSTHTFYESSFEESTRLLQECGFNVRLADPNKDYDQ